MTATQETKENHPKRVAVAGAGNIGSALIPLLGRMAGVEEVAIFDLDVYEPKNLMQQDILPGDVGQPKAQVQARRLKRINPALRVRAYHADIHDVPLGLFRADAILGCLDSLEARRVLNQAAWRLGVPWIDAGVSAEGGLFARVTVYVPSTDGACIECAWDESTYTRLSQVQACLDGRARAASTNAPASLGALTAAMQAIECGKLLEGDDGHLLRGRQRLLDLQSNTHCLTAFRRNARCKFDHRVWDIKTIGRGPGGTTFGQVLDFGSHSDSAHGWAGVEGRPFVKRLQCMKCGRGRKVLRLHERLTRRQAVCGSCGGKMVALGSEMTERLPLAAEDKTLLSCPLGRLGFLMGDVVTIGRADGSEEHYVIGCDGV